MERFKEIYRGSVIFLMWVGIAILLGGVIGLVGCAFYWLLGKVEIVRGTYDWIIYLLPLAGVIIVFLYHTLAKGTRQDTNLVLLAVRSEENVPFRMTPLIFVSTLITHLFGGSAGREGAALQMGGSIGQAFGKLFKLDQKDMHIITMCGMSACFAAVFGTPIAAAIFSLEVVSVGVMYYAALVPCAVSALTATVVSHWLGLEHIWNGVKSIPSLSPIPLTQVAILGGACAVISYIFCKILSKTSKLGDKFLKNDYLKTMVGALIVLALTFLLGTRDYLGAGTDVIRRALLGEAHPLAFAFKIVFTAVTLAAAFKGGEIVPSFFIGATFGAMAGPILGLNASFCAALGMVAVFCGVTNCPITSFLIGVELFGMDIAPFLLVACAVSYMLSGYTSLYSKQKIMYSKFRSEFINETAKK